MSVRRASPRARSRFARARWPLLLTLVAVAAFALPTPSPTGSPANAVPAPLAPHPADPFSDWSTFHGAENRSGDSPIDGPTVGVFDWNLAPAGDGGTPIRSGIVADPTTVYFSNALGVLYAYNRTVHPGLLWADSLGSTLTTADRSGFYVYVGGSNGDLNALRANNGTRLWTRHLSGPIPEGIGVANNTVYAATGSGDLVAVDAFTGAVEWSAPFGAPAAGAPAIEGGTIVVTTTTGRILAFARSGAPLWNVSVGAGFESGPAIYGTNVVVGDLGANVTDLALANGSVRWAFGGQSLRRGDSIESTPAVGDGSVFVSSFLGNIYALSLANGSLEWQRSVGFSGYPVLSSPAVAPNGLYVADANLSFDDFSPSNGSVVWTQGLNFLPSYSSPAIDGGQVYVGSDIGSVFSFGPPGGPPRFSVSGTVTNTSGGPVDGATVTAGVTTASTNATGGYAMALPNGSYAVNVSASGYVSATRSILVDGRPLLLSFVLAPVPVVPLLGRVLDSHSGQPVAGINVTVTSSDGSSATTTTAPNGSFVLAAPVGLVGLSVGGSPEYDGFDELVTIPPGGLTGLVVRLQPSGLAIPPTSTGLAVVLPIAALVAGVVAIGAWEASRRRVAQGLAPTLLSPFGRFVVMRAALVPAQVALILGLLFVFGTILPLAGLNQSPCPLFTGTCEPGGWANGWNAIRAIGDGFWQFLVSMFTLNWGNAKFGALTEPATQFLSWWLPDSVELAMFALPIAAAIAYFVGLYAGSRRESRTDLAVRITTVAGLLVPSFLLVLLFLGTFYDGFLTTFGDDPYGFLPSVSWFATHTGGVPAWIGTAEHTSPTGLPLVDALLHGDWPVAELIFLKTIWQALAIALVYVAIFLRFARHSVAQAFSEPYVAAARARGVSEGTILWHHTGRRVIPILLLVFGLTLPLYIGTQALVEAMANDTGVGALLLSEMTHVQSTKFGFSGGPVRAGNFYQATIFLLALFVIVGNLCADVLARYLDPRLIRGGR